MDTAKIYKYPNNDMDKHKLWVRFKRIDFEWDDGQGRMIAKKGPDQPVVYMYLPGSIELKDGSSYSTSQLGIMGRAAEVGINEFGTRTKLPMERLSQALDMFAGAVSQTVQAAGSIVSGSEAVNPGMVALMLHRFGQGASGAGGGVRSATRAIANPHTRSMFENVNLRTFSLNFEFIPDNERDAIHQRDIIKFFRKLAYPTLVHLDRNSAEQALNAGSEEGSSEVSFSDQMENQLVYKFPSMVQVDMFYYIDPSVMRQVFRNDLTQNDSRTVEELLRDGDQDVDMILNSGLWRIGPKLKPCYVTDVAQTLDNNNSLMYRPIDMGDGDKWAAPTTQTMSISLQEDRPLSSESIDAGY